MNTLLFTSWLTLIVYILLETEALVKWAKLFKLKFFKYTEYEEWKNSLSIEVKYKHFLLAYYNNFLISLVTCQECLIIWLNIIGMFIFRKQLGGWAAFGVICLLSILALAGLKKLLKKLYE